MTRISDILTKYSYLEIELLLANVLRKPKEFLYLHTQNNLTIKQFNNLQKLIERRETGEPIAYIFGYKDFCGLRFKVNKVVLIPRPETEWLVDKILSVIPAKVAAGDREPESRNQDSRFRGNDKLRMLDVGTGSGAIIISIAKNLKSKTPNLKFYASDISQKALTIAKQNAKLHKVQVKFIHSDLFKSIDGKFDIIVANLPYIPLKMLHKHLLHKNKILSDDPFSGLKYEPPFALTDGSSLWQIYRRFFKEVGSHLNPGALILLEIDPALKKELPDIVRKHLPHSTINFHRDFRNLWRFVVIKVPNFNGRQN